MGRDRPPGQQQPGGDLWVRQPCRQQRGDLGFGGRKALLPDRLQPGHVRGGAEPAIDLHRAGERGPGLPTVAGRMNSPPARSDRPRLPAGWHRGPAGRGNGGCSPPYAGSAIQQPRLQRGRCTPARCERRRSSWLGGRRRQASPRSPRVPPCSRRTRQSTLRAPLAAVRIQGHVANGAHLKRKNSQQERRCGVPSPVTSAQWCARPPRGRCLCANERRVSSGCARHESRSSAETAAAWRRSRGWTALPPPARRSWFRSA